jgi:RimJ/RimL family protein N-acetyltransferase
MISPILETERLVFEPFTSRDLPLIADLHSDPEVQRFLGGPLSEQAMQAMLDRLLRNQAALGYGKWKARLKDGTFVGRAGVGPYPPRAELSEMPDREIGYTFKKAYWGQGLATEAALALRDWFFAHTDHDHLMGFTEPAHVVSQRVLVRIGMRPLGLQDLGFDKPSAVFRMERPSVRPGMGGLTRSASPLPG